MHFQAIGYSKCGPSLTPSNCYGAFTFKARTLADDLLLVSGSLHQAKGMLKDLMLKAKEYGLEVHSGKTKVLWNGQGRGSTTATAEIEAKSFDRLDEEGSTEYLGRMLNLSETHHIELQSRVGKARRKFGV